MIILLMLLKLCNYQLHWIWRVLITILVGTRFVESLEYFYLLILAQVFYFAFKPVTGEEWRYVIDHMESIIFICHLTKGMDILLQFILVVANAFLINFRHISCASSHLPESQDR